MSAEMLREAAEALRERAEACEPVEGDDTSRPWAEEFDPVTHEREHGYYSPDVAYIATMHPGVGLALADQFDDMAECVEIMNDAAPRPLSEETLEANLATYLRTVDTARKILGRAS